MISARNFNNTALFNPTKLGRLSLQHRIVHAPTTRYRANDAHAHTDLALEYYAQRATNTGTLIITEATYISHRASGQANAPGIYSPEQIAAWKKITDAVHARGSYIYLQLWALGRAAYPENLATEDPSLPYVSSSAKPLKSRSATPRPLTVPEIKSYVQDYVQAAKNAVFKAGFDGIEIHAANGYLLDQFLQDVVNERTDEYGGSIENRARFALEVTQGIVDAIGEDRTAIRFSPWNTYQEMGMSNPVPQFSYIIQQLHDLYPSLAYIHLIEPTITDPSITSSANDPFRKIWGSRPLISAQHNLETALRTAEDKGDIIAFGQFFIANPDLPLRLKKGFSLNAPDYTTFYTAKSPKGYIDYPFTTAKEEGASSISVQA